MPTVKYGLLRRSGSTGSLHPTNKMVAGEMVDRAGFEPATLRSSASAFPHFGF